MEIKKNPKSNLENYSKLFAQLGLVIALFVTYVLIEKKTYEEQKIEELAKTDMGDALDEDIPMLTPPPPVTPPPPPVAPPPIAAPPKLDVKKNDDKTPDDDLGKTDVDDKDPPKAIPTKNIKTIPDPEPEFEEDVPFTILENIPVYPGCNKNDNKAKQVKCLNEKLGKHAAKNFDGNLTNELGLTPGKRYKITTSFKIEKTGKVTFLGSRISGLKKTDRAYKRLEKEAKKVIAKLPVFTPGMQRGRKVGVKYGLPIVFRVPED